MKKTHDIDSLKINQFHEVEDFKQKMDVPKNKASVKSSHHGNPQNLFISKINR